MSKSKDRTSSSRRPQFPHRRNQSLHRQADPEGPLLLFGLHAVEAALNNPRRAVSRLVATENAARKLSAALAGRDVALEKVQARQLDRLLPAGTVHQGVCLYTEPLIEPEFDEVAETVVSGGPNFAPLVVLDHVTDPHNVGAILRSAAVFGAAGLIMTRRHSPPLNGTLAKSASGALESVPVIAVQNLAKTLAALKDQGLTLLGLAGDGAHALEDEPFDRPTALIFGAEGKGLRQLTQETCDRLVRISAAGAMASLNVSNAAAVALHVAAQKRRG